MQVDAPPGLVPNSPVKAIMGRGTPSSPTKKASRQEPQNPAKVATRAMPRSPSKSPYPSALYEPATVFNRQSPHCPAVRASSPTAFSKHLSGIQDGRMFGPRRCSCCWASTKASGSGSPLQHAWSSVGSRCCHIIVTSGCQKFSTVLRKAVCDVSGPASQPRLAFVP